MFPKGAVCASVGQCVLSSVLFSCDPCGPQHWLPGKTWPLVNSGRIYHIPLRGGRNKTIAFNRRCLPGAGTNERSPNQKFGVLGRGIPSQQTRCWRNTGGDCRVDLECGTSSKSFTTEDSKREENAHTGVGVTWRGRPGLSVFVTQFVWPLFSPLRLVPLEHWDWSTTQRTHPAWIKERLWATPDIRCTNRRSPSLNSNVHCANKHPPPPFGRATELKSQQDLSYILTEEKKK